MSDTSKGKTDTKADAPAPVEFHAQDRYHAATYVEKTLHDVPGEVKTKLVAALHGMTHHRGPVQVNIPATVKPEKPAKDAPDDPLAPADGAFAVKPINFAPV